MDNWVCDPPPPKKNLSRLFHVIYNVYFKRIYSFTCMHTLNIIEGLLTIIQIFFSVTFFHFRCQFVPQTMKFPFKWFQACHLSLEEPRFYYTHFDSKMLNVPPGTKICFSVCEYYMRQLILFWQLCCYIFFFAISPKTSFIYFYNSSKGV